MTEIFFQYVKPEQLIKFSVLIAALLILFILEKKYPFFDNITFKKKKIHDINNILLGVINTIIALSIFYFPYIYLFKVMETYSIGLLNFIKLPFALSLIIGLIVYDLWHYIWHLLNHKLKFLWIFHRMHHSDSYMDASSAIRFHTLEIIISSIAKVPVLLLFGLNPFIIIIYEIILNASTIFHHSNFALPESIDSLLMYIIVTPNMHRVHHSILQIETDSNYSTTLSLWDRLFRTLKKRIYPNEIKLGLKEFNDDKWQSFIGMIKTPFVNVKKLR